MSLSGTRKVTPRPPTQLTKQQELARMEKAEREARVGLPRLTFLDPARRLAFERSGR